MAKTKQVLPWLWQQSLEAYVLERGRSAANANLARGPSLEGICGPALPSTGEQEPGRSGHIACRKPSHSGCSPLCPCSLPGPWVGKLQSTGRGAALITPPRGHSHQSHLPCL